MRNNVYWTGAFLLLVALAPGRLDADSWELPRDTTYRSDNNTIEFFVAVPDFDPDPTDKGVKGILLAGQLRLAEGLPLLREIAATDRFNGWFAPRWKIDSFSNVQDLALAAIGAIERKR